MSLNPKLKETYCSDECFRKSKNLRVDYKCDYCGKIFKAKRKDLEKLQSGAKKNLFCSAQCAKDYQRPKWEDIIKAFEERDYSLISTEYINAKSKLEYICNKHKEQGIQSITYYNLKYGFGCKYC